MNWLCEDCGWLWPLAREPYPGAECDACGGELVIDTPETTEPPLIGSVVDSETARLMASTVLDALTPEPSPQEMQK